MYSLYRRAVQDSMQRYFVDIRLLSRRSAATDMDRHVLRPARLECERGQEGAPGGSRIRGGNLRQGPGHQEKYGLSGPARTPTTLRTVLPAIPVAIALEQNYRRHLRPTDGYGFPFPGLRDGAVLKAADSFDAMS